MAFQATLLRTQINLEDSFESVAGGSIGYRAGLYGYSL